MGDAYRDVFRALRDRVGAMIAAEPDDEWLGELNALLAAGRVVRPKGRPGPARAR